MIMKYIPKPFMALQFTGENYQECKEFLGDQFDNTLNYPNVITGGPTPERVNSGDYLIKNIWPGAGFWRMPQVAFENQFERYGE